MRLGVVAHASTLGAQQDTVPAHRSRAEEDRGSPTNLPSVVRPLIGRDAQLDSIAELLGGVRLLSLIGPGGAGKTSLALATMVRAAQFGFTRSLRASNDLGPTITTRTP